MCSPPCPISPIPKGFKLNVTQDFVPFHITDMHGCKVLVKYVKVQMGPNPNIVGCLLADGPGYHGETHAQPHLDKDTKPHYTGEQLMFFDYMCAHTTDEGCHPGPNEM